ncbi:IspD/TarI family cytidylyltransferase [Demetria terragena]|uniref:IspD/TarI family cytidylyltransferase n=1 Tax=Demetria terragena TaxID=63959 RepID=UPI000475E1A7|nr:2-C-methyl-D-erythritol 4-phosphate cytidylyltransferase [Demetria terragena]
MYTLALLNGGVGSRVAAGQPKQLIRVNHIPAMVYPLVAVDEIDEITQIVLNYPDGWRDAIEKVVRDYAIKTPITFVEAGDTRHSSVRVMLDHCDNDHVIIHETARPLATADDFRTLVDDEHENVSYMLEIPFTVAPVDPEQGKVTGSLDRATLRNVQLPQKYRKSTLVEGHAHAEAEGLVFTEDATMCAVAGADVYFIPGNDQNFKITTKTDVRLAGHLLAGGDQEDE